MHTGLSLNELMKSDIQRTKNNQAKAFRAAPAPSSSSSSLLHINSPSKHRHLHHLSLHSLSLHIEAKCLACVFFVQMNVMFVVL